MQNQQIYLLKLELNFNQMKEGSQRTQLDNAIRYRRLIGKLIYLTVTRNLKVPKGACYQSEIVCQTQTKKWLRYSRVRGC